MAMVKCKECGNEISSKAEACPSCGVKRKKTSTLTWIVGGLFALVVFGGVFGSVSNSPTPARSPAQQKHDADVQRAAIGAKAIKETLRNPDSLQLESALVMASGAVCYEYRAQNGFGGINVENAVLSGDDKTFLSSSMDGFAVAWNSHCANQSGANVTSEVFRYL